MKRVSALEVFLLKKKEEIYKSTDTELEASSSGDRIMFLSEPRSKAPD